MLATYNRRAVREMARADARHRGHWNSVPRLAWLFLIDAVVLQVLAHENLNAGRLRLREFLPVVHSSDVLTGLAALFSILSLAVAGWAMWTARSHSSDVVREQLTSTPSPRYVIALARLDACSARPAEIFRASRRKLAAGTAPRRALATQH